MYLCRVFMPGIAIRVLANAVLFVGVVLELASFMILKDSFGEKQKKIYIGLVAACSAVFISVVSLNTTESVKIAVISLAGAVLLALPAYILYKGEHSSLLQKLIAIIYCSTLVFLVARAIYAAQYEMELRLSSTEFFNVGLFLMLYIVMFAGGTGFILLDKEKMDREIQKAAYFDCLTQIINRRTFIERSRDIMSLCARKGEMISCLMIDIDDFKKINDEHGHHVGDAVLVHFANTIKKALRDDDLFGRYGGDEFAILLPRSNEEQSVAIAERLRQAVEGSTVDAESPVKYTISVGVATIIPEERTDIDFLYRLSDNALYLAKEQGKNCVAMLN
jgi:diguanylate cyclase (GGDEF)-like protein